MIILDHFTYVIARVKAGHGFDGFEAPIKVGISVEPWVRMSTIQTSCPFKIDVMWMLEAANKGLARAIESSFHKQWKNKKLHGEWFDVNPIMAVRCLNNIYSGIVRAQVPDEELRDALLNKAGVYAAANRFPVPTETMQ